MPLTQSHIVPARIRNLLDSLGIHTNSRVPGVSFRHETSDAESPTSKLFNFRKPDIDSKTSSACVGSSMLEVSRYLMKR